MLFFLLDIIIISVLVLSFSAIVFLYLNPTYDINTIKDNINPTCKSKSNKVVLEEENYKEVYNIGRNVYKYDDAENVCKEFNGVLATEDQLLKAFSKGANWCNYGWVKGQKALFPIQGSFYSKLQDDDHLKRSCGNIGLNGGYFKDTNLTFGVNCFGRKPYKDKRIDSDYSTIIDIIIPKEKADEATGLRSNISHFNDKVWSMYH